MVVRSFIALMLMAGPVLADYPCVKPVELTEILPLGAYCETPWTGVLYTIAAHEQSVVNIVLIDGVVDALKAEVNSAGVKMRTLKADCKAALADSADDMAALDADMKAPPSRAAWAGIGALGAVLTGVVVVLAIGGRE